MGIKIKDILKGVKIGSGIAKVFVPGGAGQIIDIVNKSIDNDDDPQNTEALKEMAESIKQLTEVAEIQEARIRELEKRAGIDQ